MGAWDVGVFDNDAAQDFLVDLADEQDSSTLLNTLERLLGASSAESDICSEALVACEAIAAIRGKPSADAPAELRDWARGKQAPDEFATKARAAIDAIKKDSELRELWSETEEFSAWLERLEDLERRLL